ncbi:MAG: hypothetical protein D3915_14170 [Candidatus Electrothrix sp. AU1_5]|nr:hypothetical protein [Candidatus Electrothrix gigas]
MEFEVTKNYSLLRDDEKKLWDQCIFTFDSSALLNIYKFTEDTKGNIIKSIFKKNAKRLWIPSQVKLEFLRNREVVLRKIVSDKYEKMTKIDGIKENIEDIGNKIRSFDNNIKNAGTHPIINTGITQELKDNLDKFKESYIKFNNDRDLEIKERVLEVNDILNNDNLLEAINDFFLTGEGFSFDEKMAFLKEGEYRSKYQIPPGYKDYTNNKKVGIQKIGDLIIWKEIIRHANDHKKPIVLVIDDLNKNDWCYVNKKNKRIEKPREELLIEIHEKAGVSFWMYSLDSFIYNSNSLLDNKLTEKSVEEIKETLVQKRITKESFKAEEWYELDEIEILENSDSFQQTHDAIRLLSRCNHFTEDEINRILDAFLENNQVKWIATDDDVSEFLLYHLGSFIEYNRQEIDIYLQEKYDYVCRECIPLDEGDYPF